MPAGTGKPPFGAGTDDEVVLVVLDELVVVASSNPGSPAFSSSERAISLGCRRAVAMLTPASANAAMNVAAAKAMIRCTSGSRVRLTRANTEPTRRRRTGISTRRYEISASTPVTITAATNCGNVSVLPATRRTTW